MFNKKTITASKKVSIEYAQFQSLRRISFGLYIILAGILVGAFIFLYQHMYQTIGQVEALNIISPVASVEILDIDGYDTVTSLQKEKKDVSLPSIVRDPFNPVLIQELFITATSS